MAQLDGVAEPGRGRGRPPQLNRARIVAAARTLEPDQLTMQAVADALGVHRKSLNYHVSDRQGLLELVAFDAFDAGFRKVDVPELEDWRELVRRFAESVLDTLVRVGALIPYVRFDGTAGLSALAVVERIVEVLVGAGLRPGEAGRTLQLIASVAHTAARAILTADDDPIDPQAVEVRRTLAGNAEFPLLRTIAADSDAADPVRLQFAFDIGLVVQGLERRLELRARRARTPRSTGGQDQPAQA